MEEEREEELQSKLFDPVFVALSHSPGSDRKHPAFSETEAHAHTNTPDHFKCSAANKLQMEPD